MNVKKEIERHRLPCGAASIAIDGVCRKQLRDHIDGMLDELTRQVHPEGVDPQILEMDEDVIIPQPPQPQETDDEKKKRLIKEGKMKAEVKHEVEKYKEKLMGNSKMLQDISGKLPKK